MNNYTQDYFFIEKQADNDHFPSLMPDENTEDRRFRFEKQDMGSPPLIFFNGWKQENLAAKIKDIAADILFDGADIMVKKNIREQLLDKDIPDLHMHPAIYIDDKGAWHEDYWYLTFTSQLDCWDRKKSSYNPEPLVAGGDTLFSVYSYCLDEALLERTPLNNRLLFKMGATIDGLLACHKSIASIFCAGNPSGAMLTKVADY